MGNLLPFYGHKGGQVGSVLPFPHHFGPRVQRLHFFSDKGGADRVVPTRISSHLHVGRRGAGRPTRIAAASPTPCRRSGRGDLHQHVGRGNHGRALVWAGPPRLSSHGSIILLPNNEWSAPYSDQSESSLSRKTLAHNHGNRHVATAWPIAIPVGASYD
jgi:hypothetical protein